MTRFETSNNVRTQDINIISSVGIRKCFRNARSLNIPETYPNSTFGITCFEWKSVITRLNPLWGCKSPCWARIFHPSALIFWSLAGSFPPQLSLSSWPSGYPSKPLCDSPFLLKTQSSHIYFLAFWRAGLTKRLSLRGECFTSWDFLSLTTSLENLSFKRMSY